MVKLPFLRALKRYFPDARITWFSAFGKTVYASTLKAIVSPYIQDIHEEVELGRKVHELLLNPYRGQHYDLVIDTQTAVIASLIVRGIPHQHFFSAAMGWRLSDIKPPHTYQKPRRLVDLVLDFAHLCSGHTDPLFADRKDDWFVELPESALDQARTLLPSGTPYTLLAPGAGSRDKCWPLDSFISLAKRLVETDQIPVFIIGPAEKEWYDPLKAHIPQARFPLQEAPSLSAELTIALGSQAQSAVTNDAGVGHLLAASGTSMVTLFGPTPAKKFRPNSRACVTLSAQDFDSNDMVDIPVDAVLEHLISEKA